MALHVNNPHNGKSFMMYICVLVYGFFFITNTISFIFHKISFKPSIDVLGRLWRVLPLRVRGLLCRIPF